MVGKPDVETCPSCGGNVTHDDDGSYCSACYEPILDPEEKERAKMISAKKTTHAAKMRRLRVKHKRSKARRGQPNPYGPKLGDTGRAVVVELFESGMGYQAMATRLSVTVASVRNQLLQALIERVYGEDRPGRKPVHLHRPKSEPHAKPEPEPQLQPEPDSKPRTRRIRRKG